MDDTISRQAAINAIDVLKRNYPSSCYEELCKAVDIAIKALAAQQESRWIPCNEETGDGYPEEDGFYYVTEQNYGFYLDAVYKQRVTHTSHFRNGDFTDRFYAENNSNITAWMPLPKPYERSEDESEWRLMEVDA